MFSILRLFNFVVFSHVAAFLDFFAALDFCFSRLVLPFRVVWFSHRTLCPVPLFYFSNAIWHSPLICANSHSQQRRGFGLYQKQHIFVATAGGGLYMDRTRELAI